MFHPSRRKIDKFKGVECHECGIQAKYHFYPIKKAKGGHTPVAYCTACYLKASRLMDISAQENANPLYGYDTDPEGTLVINVREMKVVLYILYKRRQGFSLASIHKRLRTDYRVKTKGGKPIRKKVLVRILRRRQKYESDLMALGMMDKYKRILVNPSYMDINIEFKSQKQKILKGEGDSFSVCMANLLESKVDDILPNMINPDDPKEYKKILNWISRRGYGILRLTPEEAEEKISSEDIVPCIARGKSIRGNHYHNVIWFFRTKEFNKERKTNLIFDPYPYEKDGYDDEGNIKKFIEGVDCGFDGEPIEFFFVLSRALGWRA